MKWYSIFILYLRTHILLFFFNIINIYTHKLRWWFFISTLACIIVCCRYYKRENYYCSVYIITILCAQCAWVPFDLLLLSFNSHFYDYVCSLSSPIGHVIIKSKNKKKQKTSQQKVLSLNINFFLFLFFYFVMPSKSGKQPSSSSSSIAYISCVYVCVCTI